jgi:hypothetical protein
MDWYGTINHIGAHVSHMFDFSFFLSSSFLVLPLAWRNYGMHKWKGVKMITFGGPLFEPFTYCYKYTTQLEDLIEIQVTLQEWNQVRLRHYTNTDHICTGLVHILKMSCLVQSIKRDLCP